MRWFRPGVLVAATLILIAIFVGVRAEPAGPGASAAPDGMATITRSALPPEARATLDLIADGGPFPYEQDGSTFQNRERLLPVRPAGTYREYTVRTPGSADRGPRRLVIATTGEAYWTADHYASFARILP